MNNKNATNVEVPKEKLTPRQLDLIKQLKLWADDLPIFYEDNLSVINSQEIIAKPNVCAHLIRELDSGLRNIFGNMKSHQSYCRCKINGGKEAWINNKNLCKHCGKKIPPMKKKQIATMLGRSETDKLVTKWHNVSKLFPTFAHRDSKTGDIRDFNKFLEIWKEYDSLLQYTFGTHLDSARQIDNLLKNTTPTDHVLKAIKKILKNKALNNYFYSNLKQIDWFKPLTTADFFNPNNNPPPKLTEDGKGHYPPHWTACVYLEWISDNLPSDEKFIKEFVEVIDKIINYKEDEKRISNNFTDFSIYKILTNTPSKFVTSNHISFIKDSLKPNSPNEMISVELTRGFITKLISEDNKTILLELVDVVCSFEKMNGDIDPLIEDYCFTEFVKVHKKELSKYAGKEIIEIIINKIQEIKKEDLHSFNISWIPTIGAHEQKSFPERYESQLIDLLVECLKNLSNGELVEKNNILLKSEIDILKRIGFYLIGFKFDLLKEQLFSLKYNPLEDFNTKHELYELLKSNATVLSNSQIEIIIKWIEEKEYYLDDIKEEEKESVLAYRKKEWYLALIKSKNETIQENYDTYNALNDAKHEHPGFARWSSSWTGESTPMEEFQIENSTVDELIKRMKEFKEEKGFQKPSIRGFADTIQKDVENNPSKYFNNINKFKEVNLAYSCAILRGFINICRNNNKKAKNIIELNWNKILNFVNEQINESFWKIDSSGEFNYRDWFVSEVANLIEDGTRNDKTAFDVKLLPVAKKILLKLTKHNIFYPMNNEDYVSFALNSTEGKILDALVNYSLRSYRQVEKKFDEEIKAHFTKRIDEKKYLEVFTILGQYLPQFNSLDKKWINSKFNLIFPVDDDDILNASISGLFSNSIVYAESYKLLKEKGIYKKLLDSWETNKRNINESLLRHICLGYAEKWEEIENNSLIKDLLSRYYALNEVARFFWIIAKNIKIEYKPRVKALWKYIVEQNQNKPIAGKLLPWLNIFEELDDELVDLCMKGAKYVKGHNIYYIIEYLLKFLDARYEQIGKILLELISNVTNISDYKKEDVIKIVETLYLNNQKQLADNICNKYFDKHNLLFLRELYNRNQVSIEEKYNDPRITH